MPCTANGSGDHPLNSSLTSVSFIWCHFIYVCTYILASLDIASLIPPDLLWSPSQWRADKLAAYHWGAQKKKQELLVFLLTRVKSQIEFFAFLSFKQRRAQLLRDGKLLWVGDSCDALLSPAWKWDHFLPFDTCAFQIIGFRMVRGYQQPCA